MIGTGLLFMAALAAVQPEARPAAGAQASPFPNVVRGSNLTIPGEISPAIWPYYNCLVDSRGVERRGTDGTVQTPVVAAGADCVAQRREATEHADRILRNRSMGTTSRRAEYIETVLARVDGFVAGMGNVTPPSSRPTLAGKPADPLPSIDIPYQILPAYQVYASCVGDRFTADPRSRSAEDAAVRQANADAVAACRDVRATQLARALELLTDYRPYGGNRAIAEQAARTAIHRFDREYLIESASAPPASPAGDVIGVVRRPQRLALPGEIASALEPYLMCMVTDRDQRFLGVSTGDAARAAVERLRADCRTARDTAQVRAREMLQGSPVAEASRERIITDALTSIDHSRDDVAQHLDAVNARRQQADEPHASN